MSSMLLATTLVLLVSSVGDPCERRDDILKVRAASSADLVVLRRALDAELKAMTMTQAKGCVAAVAVEAAALAGDRAAALQHLDTMVAGLPALADDVRWCSRNSIVPRRQGASSRNSIHGRARGGTV